MGSCSREAIARAYDWCYKHIIDDFMLITSIRGTDWMDASIGREGKVFYVNVLWYIATELCYREGLTSVNPKELRERINALFWPKRATPKKLIEWGVVASTEFMKTFINPSRMHYIHFVSYEYLDDRFASLANILAILSNIANTEKRERILQYIEKERINKPYPLKSLHPVINVPGLGWNPGLDIFKKRSQRSIPHHYHNGGIWPFIGGLYVAVLSINDKVEAYRELVKLTEANRRGKGSNGNSMNGFMAFRANLWARSTIYGMLRRISMRIIAYIKMLVLSSFSNQNDFYSG